VSFLVALAEAYFFYEIIAKAELQLSGTESMESLIGDIIRAREASHDHSQYGIDWT
jgi:hypothetical protein